MPKVVNKEEKRRQIALASKDLLIKRGIKNVSVAEFAKSAGIGKGTIYEYFDSKEDIVLEILKILSDEYYEEITKKMKGKSEIEKLKIFFEFFTDRDDDLVKVYKEFLAINLSEKRFIEFNTFLRVTYLDLIKVIVKDERLATILLDYALGYFIQQHTTTEKEEFLGVEIYEMVKGRL